jgi:hypothetical protein
VLPFPTVFGTVNLRLLFTKTECIQQKTQQNLTEFQVVTTTQAFQCFHFKDQKTRRVTILISIIYPDNLPEGSKAASIL